MIDGLLLVQGDLPGWSQTCWTASWAIIEICLDRPTWPQMSLDRNHVKASYYQIKTITN